ncbi:hypothetical protein BX600DRAFT_410795 [Xylariales sp. PMI_506]|nr:hypothetical protein BX600DRAFT_410795 [Xylariales sp. PMI_506]
MEAPKAKHDLLIVTDATASMGRYLRSLRASLPEIIRISALTGCFERIGLLAYRDYYRGELTEWSGWYGEGYDLTQRDLLSFAQSLQPDHGADWPEAAKTGLAHAYEVMRSDAQTLILLYADAPPHTPATGGKYRIKEQECLANPTSYGGYGKLFIDWISAANTLRAGDKQATVFSVIESGLADTLSLHLFLTHQTGGVCLEIPHESQHDDITKLSISMLLAWMGIEKDNASVSIKAATARMARVVTYRDTSTIDRVDSEEHELSQTYFVHEDTPHYCLLVKANLVKQDLRLDNMKQLIPRRATPVSDFSKRYVADAAYRAVVVDQLSQIIRSDVTAITLNPVFGTLWRTVCNDRTNEARDQLISDFGYQVDSIWDADKKATMKLWLEQSYNYAAEILATIQEVPEEERYPCVFLDPTLDFTADHAADGGNECAQKDGYKFTREELLEIGRSCDYKVLRRLGRVLTRLTYVTSGDELPAHIKAVDETKVPRIPVALVSEKYGRKFWKMLLHTVLPGTMLAARPAALLAALSLRMGMKPLEEAADKELLYFKGWNNLDIPETWNTNCLSLLLEADKEYTQRHDGEGFLSVQDRRLFATLVDYKMLEMNLNTTLTARLGWHPDKTKVQMGPVVVCKSCLYPRSVTIMAPDGICGLCDETFEPYENRDDRKSYINANVTKFDNEKKKATWVECASMGCRAQYIVYNVNKLNVRPKCFYCRIEESIPKNHPQRDLLAVAPCVECSKCLNRIIWPLEYRPADFCEAEFKCYACDLGFNSTIVDVETTAKQLVTINGTDWLVRNDEKKIREAFTGRSLFHTVKEAGTEGFADRVAILPSPDGNKRLNLYIKGKLVHNPEALVAALQSWVTSRRVEAGTCSLCFSNFKKADLQPACGRRGCAQRICKGCREGWYGLNARGQILNVAALSCPFCRRQPAPQVVSGEIKYLAGLRAAVSEAGSWIYGWCMECGEAKRYVERVCAAGAPAEVSDWNCEACLQWKNPWMKPASKIKCCPGCGTATEKLSGCDHISCPCGQHWCFYCGEGTSELDIYEHMSRDHGGWYEFPDDWDY